MNKIKTKNEDYILTNYKITDLIPHVAWENSQRKRYEKNWKSYMERFENPH